MIKSQMNILYNTARESRVVVMEHKDKADMDRYLNWLVSKGHKVTHIEAEYVFSQTELLLQSAAEELGDEHPMYHLIQQHLSSLKSSI